LAPRGKERRAWRDEKNSEKKKMAGKISGGGKKEKAQKKFRVND